MRRPITAIAWLTLALVGACAGGLGEYAELQVSGGQGSAGSVRLTYLGTNGYLVESGGTRILVDPYFTRARLGAVALNLPIRPDGDAIERYASMLPDDIDAILVTHGHFDHLLDVPDIARRSGAEVIGSPTAVYLSIAAGVALGQLRSVLPGDVVRVGTARVTVLAAEHDALCCHTPPFQGTLVAAPAPPTRPANWVAGIPLAFLLELGGRTIYIDSGGRLIDGELTAPFADDAPPPIDVAIVGAALPDSRERLGALIERLRPSYVLPSHQDNFFRPLDEGFVFGPTANPAAVRRTHTAVGIGELIVLDYFAPWVVP